MCNDCNIFSNMTTVAMVTKKNSFSIYHRRKPWKFYVKIYAGSMSILMMENPFFGQTWLLHSLLRNLNIKSLISPEREGFRSSNFVRFILGIYIFYW